MLKRERAYWISVSAVLAMCILAVAIYGPVPKPVPLDAKTEKSKRMAAPMSHPDEFNRHFADIRGITSGYPPYPHNYRMVEFSRALERRAKLGYSTTLNWVERGPGRLGGRTRAIVLDRTKPLLDEFFVGAVGGGVWHARRYIDSFGTERIDWTPLTDHLPSLAVSSMAATPDASIMYVGTGEGFFNLDAARGVGIFKTTDRGQTWTQLASTSVADDGAWRYVNRIAMDPDDAETLVVATNGAIFRTENGGDTFEMVYDAPSRVQDLRARPGGFDTLYATVNNTAILRSTDGGRTWPDEFGGFLTAPGRMELAIAPSDPNIVYVAADAEIPMLYRTDDGGNNWVALVDAEETPWLGTQGWYDNTIAVHPYSPDTLYLGGIIRWKSTIESTGGGMPFGTVSSLSNTTPFTSFINFGAGHVGGTLDVGYESVGDPSDQVINITQDETVSVEIHFGPGLTQMAHRFTVPQDGGTVGDGGPGVTFPEYLYQDFVEVPFQVWDSENNVQLHVSFRDQQLDGAWNLIAANTDPPSADDSREYIFISKFEYDASNPEVVGSIEELGFRNGLMYFFWPVLTGGATFDPENLAESSISIDFTEVATGVHTMEVWENGEVHVDHHNITIVGIDELTNDFHMFNGNDGGFAYSVDAGETWREGDANAGFNTSQFYDATKRPGFNVYLGGTQDNGTWRSYGNANSTRGWISALGGDGFDVIWKGQDSLMGSIQFNNIQRSIDGGVNWEPAAQNATDTQFLTSLAWSEAASEYVFTIGGGGVFRSEDWGASWQLITPVSAEAWGYAGSGKVRVSLADPTVLWAGYRLRSNEGATLHVSENALNPFPSDVSQVPAPQIDPVMSTVLAPTSTISGLATHPLERETAYVMFAVPGSPKLLRTTDLGQSWEDLSGFANSPDGQSTNGFPDADVYDLEVFPERPNVIWAATELGIFESVDNGESWHYSDNGLPAVSVWRLRIADGELVAATHGRGVWSLDLSEVQTRVAEAAEVPEAFALMPNYPNPFNPSTTIGFRVPVEGHVQITVFDILGRRIAKLVDERFAPGLHQIDWDASSAASGQYFYRLEANGRIIDTQAMVLVK